MDKLESWMRSKESHQQVELDTEAIFTGTVSRIRKRARRRQAGYAASSLVVVLALVSTIMWPFTSTDPDLLTGDLFFTDATMSWYDVNLDQDTQSYETEMYWSSLDYLVDVGNYYGDDEATVLDDEELDAFSAYLEEV